MKNFMKNLQEHINYDRLAVIDARERFVKNEFGLGPFEIACWLWINKARISDGDEKIHIQCPGADYIPHRSRLKGKVDIYSCCFGWYAGNLQLSLWLTCVDSEMLYMTGSLAE